MGYKLEGNVISLNGYKYKFWLSRPIDGTIKTIIVKRDNIGDFYICITLEKEDLKHSVATGKSVGIDFGMKTFLTLSDKTEIEAPLYYLKNLKKLKKLNRNLDVNASINIKKVGASTSRRSCKSYFCSLTLLIA